MPTPTGLPWHHDTVLRRLPNLYFSTLLDWASKFFGDLPPSKRIQKVEIRLWTRKKLWNIQNDSKTTRWESINSAFWVSQFFTLLDSHWSNMAQSYWIPKMHLSIINIYIYIYMNQYDKFDCDFWTLFLTHSHIFKCFGKTQDCTSASKHPGQPQESLQPVIPFKMFAPWPEEDLLPVSFRNLITAGIHCTFVGEEKKKKHKCQYHTNCCLHCSTLRARHHHTWTGHSAAFKVIDTSDPKLWWITKSELQTHGQLNICSSCHNFEGIAPSFEKVLTLQKGSAGSRQHPGHLHFSFLFSNITSRISSLFVLLEVSGVLVDHIRHHVNPSVLPRQKTAAQELPKTTPLLPSIFPVFPFCPQKFHIWLCPQHILPIHEALIARWPMSTASQQKASKCPSKEKISTFFSGGGCDMPSINIKKTGEFRWSHHFYPLMIILNPHPKKKRDTW